MDHSNQSPFSDNDEQREAEIKEARDIFNEYCRLLGLEDGPPFDPLKHGKPPDRIDYGDPDFLDEAVLRDSLPPGLAEYLDGVDWKPPMKERVIITETLEKQWKVPKNFWVDIDTENKCVEILRDIPDDEVGNGPWGKRHTE